MTRDTIKHTLKQAMERSAAADVDWDAVDETTTIEFLGFDSLAILDLIYDIQHAFGIDFDAGELATVKTVGDLVSFLEGKGA